jgi:hypothetical protein
MPRSGQVIAGRRCPKRRRTIITALPSRYLASICRTRSCARKWVDVLRGRALQIGARIVVRTSSILGRDVHCLCSPRRRDAFACCREVVVIESRVPPQSERDWKWIDVELLPPCGLVPRPMKLAVMDPANRDAELVADSATKCTRLCKREVVRIRRHSAAHKARLPSHKFPMLLIAQPNCFSQNPNCPATRPFLGHC